MMKFEIQTNLHVMIALYRVSAMLCYLFKVFILSLIDIHYSNLTPFMKWSIDMNMITLNIVQYSRFDIEFKSVTF